jgi:transposase
MDTPPPQDPRDLRIAQLEAALAASQTALSIALERIAQLERRLGMDSTNSSKPPSTDPPKTRAQRRTRKPSGKSQGGQPGHDGHHRALLDESQVDHLIDYLPAHCHACGLELSVDELDGLPIREQVFELPKLLPTVTQHRRLACRCKACGTLTHAPSPLPAGPRYGPNLLGLIANLNVPMNVTRRATLDFVTQYLGVPASLGTIQNSLEVLVPALEPLGQQARAACERAASVGCDETGWRHQDGSAWMWSMQCDDAALYSIEPKRDTAASKAMLEPVGERVVVTDRFGSYNWIPEGQRQVCLAHLKREFAAIGKLEGKKGEIGRELEGLCGQICVGHSEVVAGSRTLKEYQEWVKSQAQPAWQELIAQGVGWGRAMPAVVSWCAHNEQMVFRFAQGSDVLAPHNNASERAVRPAVIKRKISFGTQSEAGKKLVSLSFTVSQTCKKLGIAVSDIYAQAIAAFQAGLPAPTLV